MDIIPVRSEIHTKHINALCRQTVQFFNVTPRGTYRNHKTFGTNEIVTSNVYTLLRNRR